MISTYFTDRANLISITYDDQNRQTEVPVDTKARADFAVRNFVGPDGQQLTSRCRFFLPKDSVLAIGDKIQPTSLRGLPVVMPAFVVLDIARHGGWNNTHIEAIC